MSSLWPAKASVAIGKLIFEVGTDKPFRVSAASCLADEIELIGVEAPERRIVDYNNLQSDYKDGVS